MFIVYHNSALIGSGKSQKTAYGREFPCGTGRSFRAARKLLLVRQGMRGGLLEEWLVLGEAGLQF